MSHSRAVVVKMNMILKKYFLIVFFITTIESAETSNVKPGNTRYYSNETFRINKYVDEFETGNRLTRMKPSHKLLMEKLLDTLTSNTIYLKRVDSIDFKLKRLDLEMHEQADTITKKLIEIFTTIQKYNDLEYLDELAATSTNLTKLFHQVLYTVKKTQHVEPDIEFRKSKPKINGALNTRLTMVEGSVRSILTDVGFMISNVSEMSNLNYFSFSIPKKSNFLGIINEIDDRWYEMKQHCNYNCKTENKISLRSNRFPDNCFDIQISGFNVTGVYKIKPHEDINAFSVLCDLTSAGGGWTVFQNRFDGSQNFVKNWSDYSHGFGNLASEFWLGLEKLHYLTNSKLNELRIEIRTMNDQEYYAEYSVFTVGPEYEGYRISMLGTAYGSAGDSLLYHAGQKFSTIDMDNDEWVDGSCATEHSSGWWYKECLQCNLNGLHPNDRDDDDSITWISLRDSEVPITMTRMMIRPIIANSYTAQK